MTAETRSVANHVTTAETAIHHALDALQAAIKAIPDDDQSRAAASYKQIIDDLRRAIYDAQSTTREFIASREA